MIVLLADFQIICYWVLCYRVLCISTNLCNERNRIVCFGLCGRICTKHAKIIHFKILLDFEK